MHTSGGTYYCDATMQPIKGKKSASHETASAQCAVLTDFGSKIRDQIRSKAATNQQTSKTKDKRTKNENLNYNNTPI